MIFIIIYLIGCVFSLFLFKDIFSRQRMSLWHKLGLCLYVLVFSWIGYLSYKLTISYFLDRNGQRVKAPKPAKKKEVKSAPREGQA